MVGNEVLALGVGPRLSALGVGGRLRTGQAAKGVCPCSPGCVMPTSIHVKAFTSLPAIAAKARPPEEGRRGRSPPRPPAGMNENHSACASVCRLHRLGPATAGTPQQGPRSRRQRARHATSRCPLLLPPTVSRWLGSSSLTYAAISFTQPSSTRPHLKQRGSLMRFQPVTHGVCN